MNGDGPYVLGWIESDESVSSHVCENREALDKFLASNSILGLVEWIEDAGLDIYDVLHVYDVGMNPPVRMEVELAPVVSYRPTVQKGGKK